MTKHEIQNKSKALNMKLNNIQKILFITLSNIGDVVLTLPVLSALKDKFPDETIDVVVGPKSKDVFTKDPRINRIFIYDKHAGLKDKILFIKKLMRESYDLAVDMRASLIPVLIGAKHRTSLISMDKYAGRHKKTIHFNRLKTFDIEFRKDINACNVYIDEQDKERIKALLGEYGFKKGDVLIGISPFCRSLLKQWHTEGFVEVINRLVGNKNHKIVLIGDASQTEVSRQIQTAVNDSNLINLTGKIDLNELFALIEKMNLILTCDSASLHIACDLGVKVVAIFGPTDPGEYGPTGKNDIVIRKGLKCSPCRKAVCRFNHECMNEIKAEEVLEAAENLL